MLRLLPLTFAIVGSATVVRPLSNVEMAVIKVTLAMIAVVLDFDVTVSTLSRLCRDRASGCEDSPEVLLGRAVLGRRRDEALLATASGGWIVVSST